MRLYTHTHTHTHTHGINLIAKKIKNKIIAILLIISIVLSAFQNTAIAMEEIQENVIGMVPIQENGISVAAEGVSERANNNIYIYPTSKPSDFNISAIRTNNY